MKNYKKKDTKNKTKEIFDKVVRNLQDIVSKGEYQEFLKFQNKFKKKYSFANLILIYSQCPNASNVAGAKTWEKLGREIIDRSKKIFIAAPIPCSYEIKTKVIENGEEIEKNETIKYNRYRWVYVYDIENTDGEQIPMQSKYLNSESTEDLYEKLKAFSQVPVKEEDILTGAKGYYSKQKNMIAIKNSLSIDDKTAVLLHEITHSLYDDFDYKKDRDLSEVFVESVAFIVADHFGLDTSSCSFRYILGWANGETKTVLELGSKIQDSANDFIKKLEDFNMQEQELELAA